jgi:hypothetical protein
MMILLGESDCSRVVKRVASSTNMDFVSIRNESYRARMTLRVPWRLHMNSDVYGLSNTKHLRRNVQSCIKTSSPVLG